MTPWVSVLRALRVEPGRFSLSASLHDATVLSFVSALFLMPVLGFIPGGKLLGFGEWTVIPFGIALLIVGMVVVAEHSVRIAKLIASIGILATLGLAVWFALEWWWDTGGLVKSGLVALHSLASLSLVLRGLAIAAVEASARDG